LSYNLLNAITFTELEARITFSTARDVVSTLLQMQLFSFSHTFSPSMITKILPNYALGCCYSKIMENGHRCVEGAMHHNCPVCFEVKQTTSTIIG